MASFDTIPHERLLRRLRERIADGRLLRLIESFLKAGILDGLQEWERDHQRWTKAFFAGQGYFSLEVAFATVGQSPVG
jgi:hypothetical protein